MQRETTFEFGEPVAKHKADEQAFRVSLEALAYVAILAFALVLRLAEIDSVPLMSTETHNALAAWRAVTPNASGVELTSTSLILFMLQSFSFAAFGGSEFSARLATALAGSLLVLAPLLFRPLLGSTRAFLFSLLLAFSPTLLIASRTSSPDIWALLFAAISLWGFWQAERASGYAIVAVVAFAALLFLVGTGGFVLGLILLAAGVSPRSGVAARPCSMKTKCHPVRGLPCV